MTHIININRCDECNKATTGVLPDYGHNASAAGFFGNHGGKFMAHLSLDIHQADFQDLHYDLCGKCYALLLQKAKEAIIHEIDNQILNWNKHVEPNNSKTVDELVEFYNPKK